MKLSEIVSVMNAWTSPLKMHKDSPVFKGLVKNSPAKNMLGKPSLKKRVNQSFLFGKTEIHLEIPKVKGYLIWLQMECE